MIFFGVCPLPAQTSFAKKEDPEYKDRVHKSISPFLAMWFMHSKFDGHHLITFDDRTAFLEFGQTPTITNYVNKERLVIFDENTLDDNPKYLFPSISAAKDALKKSDKSKGGISLYAPTVSPGDPRYKELSGLERLDIDKSNYCDIDEKKRIILLEKIRDFELLYLLQSCRIGKESIALVGTEEDLNIAFRYSNETGVGTLKYFSLVALTGKMYALE